MNKATLMPRAGGAIMTFAVLIGLTLAAGSTTAQAQYRDDGRRYGYDVYRVAQEQGYRDGMADGAERAQKRKAYEPEESSRYKKATNGYRSDYGDKNSYKQAYRDGFRRGYDEGYGRYGYRRAGGDDPYYRNDPYYGRNGDYGNGRSDIYQVAQDQGRRDGYERGLKDARDNDRYDPEGERQYKNADSGYRSEYGNKEEYRRIYREAFRHGYDEGYRREDRGGYRRNNRSRRAADILGTILGRP